MNVLVEGVICSGGELLGVGLCLVLSCKSVLEQCSVNGYCHSMSLF